MIESRRKRALRELNEKVEKMTKMYWYSRIGMLLLLTLPIVLWALDIGIFDAFQEQPIGLTVMQIFFVFAISFSAVEKQILDILRLMQRINHEDDI